MSFAYINIKKPFAYSELGGCDVHFLYKSCDVAGFGCTTETLSKFEVGIAPIANCSSQKLNATSNHYTCVTKMKSTNLSNYTSCLGSLGSTLVCENKIMAIMPNISESDNKTLYLRVDVFQDWLLKFIPVGLWYDNTTKVKCRPEIVEVQNVGTTNVMLLYIKCLWFIILYFFSLY